MKRSTALGALIAVGALSLGVKASSRRRPTRRR